MITTAVYIDFKNVYDSIWKANLLSKLFNCGVRGHMLNWFKGFIGQWYCQIRYDSTISEYKQLQTGFPQGAITSCSLFNIYINDLIYTLTRDSNINVLLHADNLIIWTVTLKKKAQQTIE